MARRRKQIASLEEHPNLGEILGLLAALPHIADADLPRLADAWTNTVALADARARALLPDSPLVVEVLAAFDAVQSLFAEDVAGAADYLLVAPAVATTALKAVRDAIAGAYARPSLTVSEHTELLRAWRAVYPVQTVEEPDLGPRAEQVKSVLAALPMLAGRCHDPAAADLYDELVRTVRGADEDMLESARQEAWRAAVLTSRRRIWWLVRRTGAEGLGRHCPTCRPGRSRDDEARVLALCLDAACALLVADAVDDTLTEVLTLPLSRLIPLPRAAAD